MTHRVKPGQTILFHTRDAADVLGTIAAQPADTEESEVLRASILDKSRFISRSLNFTHLFAGPVHIESAEPGDVLKVTIISIDPGEYGYTFGSGGFDRYLMAGQFLAIWRLNKEFAVSDDIPGVRIPNASYQVSCRRYPDPTNCKRYCNANSSSPMQAGKSCYRFPTKQRRRQSVTLKGLPPTNASAPLRLANTAEIWTFVIYSLVHRSIYRIL